MIEPAARVEPELPPEDSIPALVSRLIDDGENFVRAELKLYRARLFSRLDEARNAIVFIVLALSLVQAVIVAALVGLLVVLLQPLGPAGATAVVVLVGLAVAGLLAWLAVGQLRKATEIKDKDKRP